MPRKTRKQRGKGQVDDNYKKVSEWYGPRFEDWLATPGGQGALQRKNEIGDSSGYDDMKAVYSMRIPADIKEDTMPYYKDPAKENAVTKFIHNNGRDLLKGAFGTIIPVVGSIIGAQVWDKIQERKQQTGGSTHRPIGKAPQHGSGATVYRTQSYPVKNKPMTGGNSPFLLTQLNFNI